MLDFIPQDSVGAEIGVFTGLFSSLLAKERKISRITFVDPWWKTFGDYYPDWGVYTDYGRVNTWKAFQVATRRISQFALPDRMVEVASSYEWLEGQPDESLDWVYLDSTHSYEGTKRELSLLDLKIKDTGLVLGDDWQSNRSHFHHGLCLAVNECIKRTNFELILCGQRGQWILRRPLHDRSNLCIQWTDPVHKTTGAPPIKSR
jgi:hypothetical protein